MATQAEIARHLDLVQSTVAVLIGRGVLPAAERGELDVDACRVSYLRHLRAAGHERVASDLTNWRTELAHEQAKKLNRENAAARAEYIPRAEVAVGMAAVVAHCRARLLRIPDAAAPQLAATRGNVQAIRDTLREVIHRALDELASTIVESVGPDDGGQA